MEGQLEKAPGIDRSSRISRELMASGCARLLLRAPLQGIHRVPLKGFAGILLN